MQHLTTQHLLHLHVIKKITLGTLIKFDNVVKKWQLRTKSTEKNTLSSHSIDFCEPAGDDMDLEIILQENEGIAILESYKKTNNLNDGCRNILLDLIIKYLYKNNIKMTANLAKSISEKIVTRFPTEELVSLLKI